MVQLTNPITVKIHRAAVTMSKNYTFERSLNFTFTEQNIDPENLVPEDLIELHVVL